MELRAAMTRLVPSVLMVLALHVAGSGLVAAQDLAAAQDLPSGWKVAPIEAPQGETRACAATKMTGDIKGIGFTRLSSGLETMTVAVEGWAYPLGAALSETMTIGDAAPTPLAAFGQNNATLAKGSFSSNKLLRTATSLQIAIGTTHEAFDIAGLDAALDALKACVAGRA